MNSAEKATALVQKLIDQESLPALNENVSEICTLTAKKDTRSADLAAIIMRDAGMTSSVLVTANSSFYSPRYPVKTISTAVTFLGFDRVRALVLGMEIFRQTVGNSRTQNLTKLYANSYFAGSFSQQLAQVAGYGDPEEIFVAGLLSQLPEIALANAMPNEYQQVETIRRHGEDKDHAFVEVFGCSYREICQAVAREYRIPGRVSAILAGESAGHDQMTAVVQHSINLADMLFSDKPGGTEVLQQEEKALCKLLGVDGFCVTDFLRKSCTNDPNMKRYFNLAVEDVDMMVHLLEWGKASPAQVVSGLQFEAVTGQTMQQSPDQLIGSYFTELLLAERDGADLNHILMLCQEAIFKCIPGSHVFIAFYDGAKTKLCGRLYAGDNKILKASDFRVSCHDGQSPVNQVCRSGRMAVWQSDKDPKLGLSTFTTRKLNLKSAMLCPLRINSRSIGLYLVGRSTELAFSVHEEVWLKQITDHVCKAFYRQVVGTTSFVSKTL